jgi:hypothetical protein
MKIWIMFAINRLWSFLIFPGCQIRTSESTRLFRSTWSRITFQIRGSFLSTSRDKRVTCGSWCCCTKGACGCSALAAIWIWRRTYICRNFALIKKKKKQQPNEYYNITPSNQSLVSEITSVLNGNLNEDYDDAECKCLEYLQSEDRIIKRALPPEVLKITILLFTFPLTYEFFKY